MNADATQALLTAMRAQPTLAFDFLADLGGDPEEYGDFDKDWSTAAPDEVGLAFASMVAELVEGAPELMRGFADINLAAVDHRAIGHEVFRLLAEPVSPA